MILCCECPDVLADDEATQPFLRIWPHARVWWSCVAAGGQDQWGSLLNGIFHLSLSMVGSLFSNLWRVCHSIGFYTAGVDLLWEQSNSLVNILPHLTSPPLTEEHWYRFMKTKKGRYESRYSSFSQAYDQPRRYIKKQRHNFADKGPSSQIYGFSSGHVRMWELDYKESWVPKKKSVLNIHWKDWCWSWNSNPLATWCEELTHSKRPWC